MIPETEKLLLSKRNHLTFYDNAEISSGSVYEFVNSSCQHSNTGEWMIDLKEAEKIELIVLMDNYSDVLLPSSQRLKRFLPIREGKFAAPLFAEHGFSLLVRLFENKKAHSLLLDAGWSEDGVVHNLKKLDVDIAEVETIILSHGHMDHHGALHNILALKGGPVSIIAHPDAFLKGRFVVLPDGEKVTFPAPDEALLRDRGAHIIKNKSPYLIASDLALVSGEIERTTGFEKGLPNAFLEREGNIENDHILDDQALIIHLKQKGLVVISGCAHAGIINTVTHARKITGVNKVYGVMGGFHLTGPAFEPIIGETIKELKAVDPEVILPMHCTGWKATVEIAQHLPRQFVLSSVGTTLTLGAD